jgi:hypothetical protein
LDTFLHRRYINRLCGGFRTNQALAIESAFFEKRERQIDAETNRAEAFD